MELKQHTLKNDGVKEYRKGEIKIYEKANKNDNTPCRNFWDTAKAVTKGKFTSLQAYLKK